MPVDKVFPELALEALENPQLLPQYLLKTKKAFRQVLEVCLEVILLQWHIFAGVALESMLLRIFCHTALCIACEYQTWRPACLRQLDWCFTSSSCIAVFELMH